MLGGTRCTRAWVPGYTGLGLQPQPQYPYMPYMPYMTILTNMTQQ